jgi:hypothetical protein
MIRLMAVIGILLCTSGCGVLVAEVKYVQSPNSLPAAGSVFVEGIGGGDGGAAYGWLAMYGYDKAPSSDQAAYVMHISDQTVPVYTTCSEGVDVITTRHGDKFKGNGDVVCNTVYGYQLYVAMRRQIQGQPATEPSLVEIEAVIPQDSVDDPQHPPFPPATISDLLLESAFAIFPGVEGTTKELIFHVSGDLVCIKTVGGFLNPTTIHCRKPDAPPGILTSAPSS